MEMYVLFLVGLLVPIPLIAKAISLVWVDVSFVEAPRARVFLFSGIWGLSLMVLITPLLLGSLFGSFVFFGVILPLGSWVWIWPMVFSAIAMLYAIACPLLRNYIAFDVGKKLESVSYVETKHQVDWILKYEKCWLDNVLDTIKTVGDKLDDRFDKLWQKFVIVGPLMLFLGAVALAYTVSAITVMIFAKTSPSKVELILDKGGLEG